ncbi:hypothetical protein BJX99DRAFT_260285 [Aspergillus californicus]
MSTNMRKYRVTKSTSKSSKLNTRLGYLRKAVPRQDSPSVNDPRNRTSHHPDQTDWSVTSLPDILYQLKPEGSNKRAGHYLLMKYSIHGKYLRQFEILPDNISSAVEEFRVEAWMRMDNRICLKDITDRMHPDFRINQNALQQRGVRFRQAFNMIAWGSGNKRSRLLEAELLARMEELGLDTTSNSTRGITPGLINPKQGEAAGRVPLPRGWGAKLGIRLESQKIRPSLTIQLETVQSEVEALPVELEAPLIEEPSLAEEDLLVDIEGLPLDAVAFSFEQAMSFAEPAISDQEVEMIDFFPEYVHFDEKNDQPNGSLPIIRGVTPDDELPTTVRLRDLNLLEGIRQPEPEVKQNNDAMPLLMSPTRIAYRAPYWTTSSVISPRSFCISPCFPESPMDYLDPINNPLNNTIFSKPQTSTAGLFPVEDPLPLNNVPNHDQQDWINWILNDYTELHMF